MKSKKILFIILFIGFIIYYFIPDFAQNMNEDVANNYASVCVIFINSIYMIASSIVLTKYLGFKWYYPLLIGILFIPSVILYFNYSCIYYVLIYIVEYFFGSSLYIKYKK